MNTANVQSLLEKFNVKCVICGNEGWSVAKPTFRLDEYQPKGNYQAVLPIVMLICENCGHIESFSVAKLMASMAMEGKKGNDKKNNLSDA